jgi:RNA polymerase sigma factor (sigma-70 family)
MAYSAAVRMLGDPLSADEAVQVTFVIFARKAAALSRGVVLAGWIHRTVCLVSRRMLEERACRARREREAAAMKTAIADQEALWRALRPELDEAIGALPARYRDVVTLHYLAGWQQSRVAYELGCPEKTVQTRLSRALEKLRQRLLHRGVAVDVPLLAACLAGRTLESVPAALMDSVTAVCTGKAAATAASSIADGVLKMMLWAKVKLVAACVAGAILVGGISAPLMMKAVAQKDTPQGSLKGAGATVAVEDVYDKFNKFCIKHFGAEREDLIYEKLGKDLKFLETGLWMHASENSACIGFETNLPAKAYVEYGETMKYGSKTSEHERHYYLHLHYLKDLKPSATYHCRLAAVDERGNSITSKDMTFTTSTVAGAIHVPGDLQGPPYVLDRTGATYVVTHDLTIEGKAFEVKADNVTLDLGGRTVIYNNRATQLAGNSIAFLDKAHFGVLCRDKKGLKIFNGTIKQGMGDNAAGEDSIGFNPICTRSAGDMEVAGATVEYGGKQMVGIHNEYYVSAFKLHHNVFLDHGRDVSNRYGSACRSFLFWATEDAKLEAHHNLVKRTRQMGLDGTEVYDNEIYIDSRSTNSFGIDRSSLGRRIHHNRLFGTGFHVMAVAWGSKDTIYDNLIHLEGQEPVLAMSYGELEKRCDLVGFRLTQDADGKTPMEDNLYHNNLIVINVREGSAGTGVWFYSDPCVKNLIFRNNIIKVMAMDQKPITTKYPTVACVTAQGDFKKLNEDRPPVVYQDNTFISNMGHVQFGDNYGVGSNHQFYDCKFVKVGSDLRYRTFRWDARNHYASNKHVVRDPVFEGGAGLDSISFGNNGDRDLTVQWTFTAKTAPGAKVSIRDKIGDEVFSGEADQRGLVSAPLSQYVHKQKGSGSEASERLSFTPHNVRVEKGNSSVEKTVTVDRKQELEIPLR